MTPPAPACCAPRCASASAPPQGRSAAWPACGGASGLPVRDADPGPAAGDLRLLIADDVGIGIGKTIEAGLIASELLAQGDARRLAVLCSPALAEQWQKELRGKFGIDAELVLTSTVKRLIRTESELLNSAISDSDPVVFLV